MKRKYTFDEEEIQQIIDSIEYHLEGCQSDMGDPHMQSYIKKGNLLIAKLTPPKTLTAIVNVNLEIKTDAITEDEATEFVENYELPKEYVEDSFEIVKFIKE